MPVKTKAKKSTTPPQVAEKTTARSIEKELPHPEGWMEALRLQQYFRRGASEIPDFLRKS